MFDAIVSRLPAKVQPYAKAYAAAAPIVTAAVADLALSGDELRAILTSVGGITLGLIVAAVPNREKVVSL